MTDNLDTLFSGAFYIDAFYGASLGPSLYRSIIKGEINVKEEDLLKKVSGSASPENIESNKRVAVLNFNQPVVKYTYRSWLGTQSYISILESLVQDSSVIGVVFNVDSGGGQVYGTGEFFDYIKKYPKPTATYTNGYLCSGAYYFAAATDYIVANERADAIGSIGAYSTIVDSSGILEHFGAKVHTMYGTKSTEKNSDYREVIENSNYEPYIKNQLDPIIETFHSDMKSARPQLSENVFKGKTWTGAQSTSLGLIDETGNLNTAINKVVELSNTNNKSNSMSRLNVPNIENVLGEKFSQGETETGILLTDDQAQAIETRLQENEDALSNASETANQLEALTTSNDAAVSAIDAALTEAEIEFTPEMSLAEKVNLLEAQRKEFAGKTGGGKTVVDNGGDEPPAGGEEQKVYAHNEEAKKILGIN